MIGCKADIVIKLVVLGLNNTSIRPYPEQLKNAVELKFGRNEIMMAFRCVPVADGNGREYVN